MGGTFDPIHYGHLVCADEAVWKFELDEVIFVPSGSPWQKSHPTAAEDRYQMVVAATADHPKFSVSRAEIDRRGPTYTADTLELFRERFGEGAQLFFITGADAILEILTWKDPETVLSLARFIAATRPGYDLRKLGGTIGDRMESMEIPALAISSTDIRERVSLGKPIKYLVPDAVARYISQRGLYRNAAQEQSA